MALSYFEAEHYLVISLQTSSDVLQSNIFLDMLFVLTLTIQFKTFLLSSVTR